MFLGQVVCREFSGAVKRGFWWVAQSSGIGEWNGGFGVMVRAGGADKVEDGVEVSSREMDELQKTNCRDVERQLLRRAASRR